MLYEQSLHTLKRTPSKCVPDEPGSPILNIYGWGTDARVEQASSLNAVIAHVLFENDWYGFYDYSHGGNDKFWGEGKTFEDMETLDNPLCQGDGSVTIRKKSEVEIKAIWDYGGYNQFYY